MSHSSPQQLRIPFVAEALSQQLCRRHASFGLFASAPAWSLSVIWLDCVAGAVASHGDSLLKSRSRYSELPRVVERPYFDDVSPRNVTVVVGQPALLKCRVRHIGNRTVSTASSLTKNNWLVNLCPSSARLFIIKITSNWCGKTTRRRPTGVFRLFTSPWRRRAPSEMKDGRSLRETEQ
jgi:hypothetical protein